MKMYADVLVLGVAGNFAGHLQQAGEARDFAALADADINKPQALFPIYLPAQNGSFLTNFPLSHHAIQRPLDVEHLQIEPELALLCDIRYEQGDVVSVTARQFGAFNDCSIRRPNANKISEKKNWGTASKGVSEQMFPLEGLEQGSYIDQFRIASFHKRGDQVALYGEDCAVSDYTYFYQTLTDWVCKQMNEQQDIGPKENIKQLLVAANYPKQVLLAVGATRYTAYGERHFLERGDVSMVVVYDQQRYTPEQIAHFAQHGHFSRSGIAALVQTVF